MDPFLHGQPLRGPGSEKSSGNLEGRTAAPLPSCSLGAGIPAMTRSSVVVTVSPHHRVADEVRRRHRAIPGATPFTLRLPDGVETLIGEGEPDVTLVCTSRAGLDALSSFDLATAGEAYLAG